MRISDWSSDVCSSDLLSLCEDGRRDATEQRGGEERGDRPACAGHHERNHWLSTFDKLKASTKMRSRLLRRPSAVHGCWITNFRNADQGVEATTIGRRKGREREWQVGEETEGAET